MTHEFDRQRLAAALSTVNVRTDVATLDRIYRKLMELRRDYIWRISRKMPGGGAEPSKELVRVNAALRKWLPPPSPASHSQWFTTEHCLVHQFDEVKMAALIWLRDATTQVIERLESNNTEKTKNENPTTRLLRELYFIYREETGKSGIYNGGPAHRFVQECAAIVYSSVVVPKGFQQRLAPGLKRLGKKENGAYKNGS
jgi:hypothetical protein